jgi:hypothetical protein
MTENPAASTEDAKSLLDAVETNRSTVRRFTEPGTITDFFVITLAQSASRWLAPTNLDRSGPRIALTYAAFVGLVGFTIYNVRHRHNLGGSIQWPTWLIAAAMFAVSAPINIAMHGDAKDNALTAVFGVAIIALGVAYRKYLPILLGGAAVIGAAGATNHWPVAAWLTPVVLWIAVFGYLGRKELAF